MSTPNDPTTTARLESIRAAIRSESVSYGELAELQALAGSIDPDDVELTEWAGIDEHVTCARCGATTTAAAGNDHDPGAYTVYTCTASACGYRQTEDGGSETAHVLGYHTDAEGAAHDLGAVSEYPTGAPYTDTAAELRRDGRGAELTPADVDDDPYPRTYLVAGHSHALQKGAELAAEGYDVDVRRTDPTDTREGAAWAHYYVHATPPGDVDGATWYAAAVKYGASIAARNPDVSAITAAVRGALGPYRDTAAVEVIRPAALGATGTVYVYPGGTQGAGRIVGMGYTVTR